MMLSWNLLQVSLMMKATLKFLKAVKSLIPLLLHPIPPADQMETLTVESPIPIVSLLVLTACLNDSPEPSSEARLISKRVANQEETSSLDNILSQTNRIHKDHPKSQIIGPVDTPIQTMHKSKEVEEQSFIASIYQKTDPALLQLCLFSCFLSQVEPKKTLVDCPNGVRPIGTKWVLKNKKDERGIVIRNIARLVAQRYIQEEWIDYDEVFAPVARIEATRLFLAYASFMGFTVYQMDVKSAFLYAEQVEPAVSLTVETKIPTVSSPVPTVYLNTSPRSSSDPRIISKGDFSQQETPSLGNALTLSNMFEDTFGKEADLSNMETSILEEPKKIFDAFKDPSWVEAMPEELLNSRFGINKARLVAQGYTQEEGIDYEEVFALVSRIEAIRLFLAYASFMGFTVYQMDVKSAFLYGTIDEEVYLMQLLGFQDPEFLDRVYKVEKAIHYLSESTKENSYLSKLLQKKDGIFLSQDKYVDDILNKFGYSDVSAANTPMDKENPWEKDRPGKDVELHLYRSMIGSLMYLTASRIDVMFDVCAYARHQVTPKECHLHVVKKIFRYLKGHPKLELWYPKDSPFDLVAYSDSDYGGSTQDRKSTTGGCQFLRRRLISTSTYAAPAMTKAAIRQLVADSVATALEAQAANMENTDNTNRNTG
nr:hypothetical protein [Tanacetum cinerariifolium]